MDSFYDVPRRPPAPISRETLAAVPVVPEISVLCSSNGPRNAFVPYSQWKQQHNTAQNICFGPNKENHSNLTQNSQNSSILKKQVRFESPVLQQQPVESKKPEFCQNIVKNLDGGPHIDNKGIPSFEQMYMANIPNRQLDLSIIDLPRRTPPADTETEKNLCQQSKREKKEKETPKTYKEFLESQKNAKDIVLNDSVTDIFNYKANSVKRDCVDSKMQAARLSGKDTKRLKVKEHNNFSNWPSYPSVLNKNEPVKSEKYFQGVSQAIAQRSGNKSPIFETQLDNRRQSKKHVQQPDASSLLQNGQLFNKNVPSEGYKLREHRISEVFHNENKSVPNENREQHFHRQNDNEFKRNSVKTTVNSEPQVNHDYCTKSTNTSTNLESNGSKVQSDNDLSVKDLLKIIAQQSQQIAQQNTQLLLLQQQVSDLVLIQKNNELCRPKGIECGHYCQYEKYTACNNHCADHKENIQEKCITSTRHEVNNGPDPNKNRNHLPNFSIGLMTSFEVSFKRPSHRNQNEFPQKNTKVLDFEPDPPRIQEITETESTESCKNYSDEQKSNGEEFENDNKETLVDTSMVFKEPIQVRETCPSPEPSIKIDMNDFDDSDIDDDSSRVEASFYRNLMTQVNKILQKAQIETADEIAYNVAGAQLNNKTMHKVKQATLKHLRKIGVDLPSCEEISQNSSSSDEIDGRSYNQEDISFAVKQLLMKYLPADHLARLAAKEARRKDPAVLTPNEKIGAIKNRPEFSFATVQYMKKYNLIASNNQEDFYQPPRRQKNPLQSPKILDITKLKQQPKLL